MSTSKKDERNSQGQQSQGSNRSRGDSISSTDSSRISLSEELSPESLMALMQFLEPKLSFDDDDDDDQGKHMKDCDDQQPIIPPSKVCLGVKDHCFTFCYQLRN